MGKPIRIQRKRIKGWKMPANTIYVGRPTKWGNPYKNMPRDLEVKLYDRWIFEIGYEIRPSFIEIKKLLKGKNLACWCPLDKPCHADILLKIANSK